MDEASEEDRICPYAVPRAIDEGQLSCLEIYPTQRVVSQMAAQNSVIRESFRREEERSSLPFEFADVSASAAAAHRPA
jgi:hypothetical protein